MRRTLLGLGLVAIMAMPAIAVPFYGYTYVGGYGYTNLGPTSNPGEPGQVTILNNVYGAGWAATGTALGLGNTQYTNAGLGLAATRIPDVLTGGVIGNNLVIGLGPGSNVTDQIWEDGITQVAAKALWSGLPQQLLMRSPPTVGVTTSVLGPLPDQYNWLSGPTVMLNITPGATWEWRRSGVGILKPTDAFSVVANNTDGCDHMITYEITGLASPYPTYLIMFEDIRDQDQPPGAGADWDYNDLIVEITAIPEPITMLSVFVGLSGLAGYIRKRRRA